MRMYLMWLWMGHALALSACGSKGDGGATGMAGMTSNDPTVAFEASVLPVINVACNCHQSEPILMAPFSLKPAEAYDNLVDKPSIQVTTMPLVEPGSLNQSYLWHKVNGTHLEVGGSGLTMPSTIPLDATQLAAIERWIAAGAPR
jgi:hypothetical protein